MCKECGKSSIPKNLFGLAATGMLSPDGRCKTLDASADGYVRAENCIVLLLASADSAYAAAAFGIIKSSAVNQVPLMDGFGPIQPSCVQKAFWENTMRSSGRKF